MLKNYIKIALRNLWKNKGFAIINISGLMVAFCIGSLLILTAYFQLTFDSFHQNSKQIYQAYFNFNEDGDIKQSPETPLPLYDALKAEFDEIEGLSRVNMGRKTVVTANNKTIEKLVVYADHDFFSMFTFPLKNGSSKTALADIQNMVISQNTAEALFGKENPVGKTILLGKKGEEIPFIVSAVADECPYNSTIKFDAICRMEAKPNFQQDKSDWGNNAHSLFVMLSKNTNATKVEQKLVAFTKKYYPQEFENKNSKIENIFQIKLLNLSKVHFDKAVSAGKSAPIAIVYALIGLAVFILLIACFNFINLSIAKNFKRAKEMGVRKTLGALKGSLFIQLWSESVLICLVGFVLGFSLVISALPIFNAQFNAKISTDFLFQPLFLAIMTGLFVVVTLIAGGYPAYKMSRLDLVEVLKGKVTGEKSNAMRNTLIVSQFAISSLLICITLISNQQLNHLRQRPLGFNKDQVISIPVGNQLSGKTMLELCRNEFRTDPSIMAISGSNMNLGKGKDKMTTRNTVGIEIKSNKIVADWMFVDGDFLGTMTVPLLEGISQNSNSTQDVIWVSESLKKAMGNGPILNTFLSENKHQITGVFKDFNLYSPSTEVLPIVIQQTKEADIQYIFMKVKTESMASSMKKMETFWKKKTGGLDFMGTFLDENVEAWYQNESMLIQIFSFAASLAIFLSCMGLFAVSLLVIELRTKEIGIRKVMGASVQNIVLMLSKYFLKFIFLSFLIAFPLAWFAMDSWLKNYSYRIDINATPFVIVIVSVTLLALLTVGYQAIKVALMNPVKSLKTE
jgi:putative ABC transport system permease protein